MAPHVVLVTGVALHLGGRLAALLQNDPAIDRVIGVDVVPPRGPLGRTEFVRTDIRSPILPRLLDDAGVDTVVHMSVLASPRVRGGRPALKENNVIGTMQLLAACQKAASVRRLVVKSTTAVYGSSPRDPAVFTEESDPLGVPRSGFAHDAVEVEGYVRGLARRRPDVAVTTLRFANLIGPRIETPLTRYFALPVVPTVLGFDPRIQLLHEDDGVAALAHAVRLGRRGVFNVGGAGVLLLSQAIRRAGRVPVPVPSQAVNLVARALGRGGVVDLTPEQLRFLEHGRVVDTTRLVRDLGFTPAYSTAEAFADFVTSRLHPLYSAEQLRDLESAVLARLGAPVTAGESHG